MSSTPIGNSPFRKQNTREAPTYILSQNLAIYLQNYYLES